MRPALAFLHLVFLYLFAATVESRKGPGDHWKIVMKDEEISERIDGLKHKCDDPLATNTQVTVEKMVFSEDFEPRPNISASGDDEDVDSNKENKKFVKDFEPSPNISAFDEEVISATEEKKIVKNFEPRPNLSAYSEDNNKVGHKGDKVTVNNEFEPRPSATKYSD